MINDVGWLGAHGPLRIRWVEGVRRPCLDPDRPGGQPLRRVDWGWSTAQYENWLRTTLTAGLLP